LVQIFVNGQYIYIGNSSGASLYRFYQHCEENIDSINWIWWACRTYWYK